LVDHISYGGNRIASNARLPVVKRESAIAMIEAGTLTALEIV